MEQNQIFEYQFMVNIGRKLNSTMTVSKTVVDHNNYYPAGNLFLNSHTIYFQEQCVMSESSKLKNVVREFCEKKK